ncbi:Type VI secretion system VasI, EvfG, VC_A0118 [Loktanella sp. DSM 29012]|uniref:type VI secretion system-associated protein TagO n=1 Tax=Loktanella sp. DSM 29012 TaxID=1881056 RepID=UPI0008BE9D82|nr:type VI secretion system-associated protein TagO [Loktanella sp. DSM 29012]SEP83351.1 Type VI secretion system VasI, EvfG, VC_A0118 [Loktanella sp. DSM 29012]
MRTTLLLIALAVFPHAALSQAALERHVWQDARSFAPYSRTAEAITGAITLSGNDHFATKGSTMSITFGNGTSVGLVSEGATWRPWSLDGEQKQTAEIFRLSNDHGPLQNGNTLCGEPNPAQDLYAVFFEDLSFDEDFLLHLAMFQSSDPPFDIHSPGLCGTYTYSVDAELESAPAPGSSTGGDWRIQSDINPLDDTRTVTLLLTAEEGKSQSGDPVVLVARCQSNKTEVYAIWDDYLGDDSSDAYAEWKRVIVRVGQGEAREERWSLSTDKEATFAPEWPGAFLKELLDEERLVLQTTPYSENPITAVFGIAGLRDVLGELAQTCNWSF